MQVVLNVDAESESIYSQVVEAANQYLNDETRLTNIRQYLEVFKHTDFFFNEEITKVCNIFIDIYIYIYIYIYTYIFIDL